MGLLDDAIREHLDLKRRRGADPAEVERMEREALGPVRRGPAPLDAGTELAAGYEEPEPREEELAYDEAVAPVHADDEPARGGYETLGYDDEVPVTAYEDRFAGEAPDDEEEPYEEPPVEGHERTGVGPLQFRPRSLRDRLLRREAASTEDEGDEEPAPGATAAPSPAAAPPPEPEFPARYGQETVEYQALDEQVEPDELEEAHPQQGEAILEETPEFLQDTPDHDRLWFEQRPPRDFDFDG